MESNDKPIHQSVEKEWPKSTLQIPEKEKEQKSTIPSSSITQNLKNQVFPSSYRLLLPYFFDLQRQLTL